MAAQNIVPLIRTSSTEKVRLTILERLSLTPYPKLPDTEEWQVRIIRAARATLAKWGEARGKPIVPGAEADTCVEFPARLFTFSPPVNNGVLVSLVPDEDWLDSRHGRLDQTIYFAVIEKRFDDEQWGSGDLAPLRIRRSSINDYLKYGAEIELSPRDDSERRVRINLEKAVPTHLREECRVVGPGQQAAGIELDAVACESSRDLSSFAQ
jgi:hypothetical protein